MLDATSPWTLSCLSVGRLVVRSVRQNFQKKGGRKFHKHAPIGILFFYNWTMLKLIIKTIMIFLIIQIMILIKIWYKYKYKKWIYKDLYIILWVSRFFNFFKNKLKKTYVLWLVVDSNNCKAPFSSYTIFVWKQTTTSFLNHA